jgi:hypothetical protein
MVLKNHRVSGTDAMGLVIGMNVAIYQRVSKWTLEDVHPKAP